MERKAVFIINDRFESIERYCRAKVKVGSRSSEPGLWYTFRMLDIDATDFYVLCSSPGGKGLCGKVG